MKILFASDTSFNYFDEFPGIQKVHSDFSEAAEVFKTADFSVVNLENIFGDKNLYTPIAKSGPNLISDERFIEYIDMLNPTIVGLSNNHSKDYGSEAMYYTIDLLKQRDYKVIGAGENIEEAYEYEIIEKDGIKCAIFAVCENEFGIAEENVSGTSGYKYAMIYKTIQKALEENARPIVYFHGGNETNPFPSPGKVELYRMFIDMGAMAVIAMHTHCPQGYEIYKGCPIVYSMGNFFFPANARENTSWFFGYMSMLNIGEDKTELEIIPYKFSFDGHEILKDAEKEKFLKYINFISEEIKSPEKIQAYFDSWCMVYGIIYADCLHFDKEEYERYTPEEIAPLKNVFSCEAHNELLTNTLKIIFEGRTAEAKKGFEKIKKLQKMEL